jgi:hypothetical protein
MGLFLFSQNKSEDDSAVSNHCMFARLQSLIDSKMKICTRLKGESASKSLKD